MAGFCYDQPTDRKWISADGLKSIHKTQTALLRKNLLSIAGECIFRLDIPASKGWIIVIIHCIMNNSQVSFAFHRLILKSLGKGIIFYNKLKKKVFRRIVQLNGMIPSIRGTIL